MGNTAGTLIRSVQIIFFLSVLLWIGMSIYGMLQPRDPFSKSTDALFTYWGLLLIQLVYPVFALVTRRNEWNGGWRVLRIIQAVAVVVIVVGFLLLLASTVDVSGFRS
jgi:FtsH-binding integral membrane protein